MSTKKRLRIVPSLVGGTPILACTRFNNNTWQEYQQWMTAHQESYEQTYHRPLKCIYGCPREISHKKIPPEEGILVIEMNNDENRIMGIGQIENKTASETYRTPSRVVAFANAHSTPHSGTASNLAQNPPPFRKIFSDRNYTRYLYIGNSHYATREELERNYTPDAQYINKQLANILPQTPHPIESLERLLFKGAGHMKRGSGITRCSVAALLGCCVAPRGKAAFRNYTTSRFAAQDEGAASSTTGAASSTAGAASSTAGATGATSSTAGAGAGAASSTAGAGATSSTSTAGAGATSSTTVGTESQGSDMLYI
jgi:hypothetical protein